jgi:MGT family glycosyltransferase
MKEEDIRTLDTDALRLFALKGTQGGTDFPEVGLKNGVKVRRIMQITRDLSPRPFDRLRILDLGCGEGVYAIEAGLRGAQVIALDARTTRMDQGAACSKRHGLERIQFIQEDVRRVRRESLGAFDVVYFLGLLYHLDVPDVFSVLEHIFEMSNNLLVLETIFCQTAKMQVKWRDRVYEGHHHREHEDEDSAEIRKSKLLKSIDNTFSFRFTKESLERVLHDVGFTSVFECHVPFEPGKPADRVTLAALKGLPVRLSTYPWVNHKTEDEIGQAIQSFGETKKSSGVWSLPEAATERMPVMNNGRKGGATSPPATRVTAGKQRTAAFFSMTEIGHFRRMRPLISGLLQEGITPVVYTHRMFKSEIERNGGIFIDLFSNHPLESADDESIPIACRFVTFAGKYAEEIKREVVKIAPSLVIHDSFAVIGRVIADLLGLPRVNVCAGHNGTPEHLLAAWKGNSRLKISSRCLQAVEVLRESYGLQEASPFSYASMFSPQLNIYCEPPEFLDEEERQPFEPVAFYGSLPYLEDLNKKPEGPSGFGSEGISMFKVYISFGTVIWRYFTTEALRALKTLAETFSETEHMRVIISLGGSRIDDAALNSLRRSNVTIESYVDQQKILQVADVFVTHQGMNSTHEAIFHRVPMISYPFFADQPGLAAKCWKLGLAIPLAESLRGTFGKDQVQAVLGRLADEADAMKAALSRAHEWELAVMENRSSVHRRIADLL